MLEEQLATVRIFREHYDPGSVGGLVIYGTGINAEAVIDSCGDYPIAGVMDASKTGQVFCGKKVLSQDEVLGMGIGLVVVVARPAVHRIIYKRLQPWLEENRISMRDIWGNDIAGKVREEENDSPYFSVSYEQLWEKIEKYDVISFDIFDTLLTRKVYEPGDVFSLLDREYEGWYPFTFSCERARAERELSGQGEPDIYHIYDQMGKNNPCLSNEDCQELLRGELGKERLVLTPRKRMVKCLRDCVRGGKRVVLVSDMYLPGSILRGILGESGITQYEKLFVSCDYGVSKKQGLFKRVREYIGNDTCLHIGDSRECDGMAEKEGMDTFLIMSSSRMLEISSYSPLLVHLKGLESRVMVGMMASEVFNDPFILEHTKGKPPITKEQRFGYVFIAPLAVSFIVWLLKKVEREERAVILFSARDGWLIQQLYRLLSEKFQIKGLPRDEYLLISRKAVLSLEGEDSSLRRRQYTEYLSGLGLEGFETIYFFDFMSRGTCQCELEKLVHRQCHGIYVQKSGSGDVQKDRLNVESYYKERSAQEADRRVFALCDFLECIFTSFEPSFLGFDEDGKAVYDRERRSGSQLACVEKIHQGIWDYTRQFAEIIDSIPKQMPAVEFGDEMLGMVSSSRSRILIPELKEMVLDDIDYGDKNTGLDALA